MMQAARELIIAKEVSKVKRNIQFAAVTENKRPNGSARGYRSGSEPPKKVKGKKSEVAKQLSEQHDIELKEQIELLNDDSNEIVKPLKKKRLKTCKEGLKRPPISGKNFLKLNMNIQSNPIGDTNYSSIGPVGPPSGFTGTHLSNSKSQNHR